VRRFLACLVASFVALGAGTAFAAWSPGGNGSGRTLARAIGVPTSVSATALNSSTIQITWAAPGGGSVTPTQYVVRRTAPSTATVCTVAPPTTTCNDTGLAGSTTYSYTVESRIGTNWTSGPSGTVSATTTGVGTFIVSAGAGNKTAGTPFTVTLTATTNGFTTDTSYVGVKTITFSGPGTAASGTAPTYPATVTFVAGVGSASVTLYKVESPTLNATDGTISGSTTLTVVAGSATQLLYTSSSVSCASGSVIVGNGGSFTSKVTAYDTWLNPVVGTRTVTVSKNQAGGTLNPTTLNILAGASETSASTTFTLPVGNPPDTTVTAASAGLSSANCVVKKN
jgi:hypothetical protein